MHEVAVADFGGVIELFLQIAAGLLQVGVREAVLEVRAMGQQRGTDPLNNLAQIPEYKGLLL